jgi:hypothetical protein
LTDGTHRTTEQARKSALTVAAVLLLFAAWNVYRGRPVVYFTLGGIAVTLALVGWLWPGGARIFDRSWMFVAGVLGYINSRILLSIMFYGVMAPYGIVMRLFGRNTLNRRGPNAGTYWIPRKKTRQLPAGFERQF